MIMSIRIGSSSVLKSTKGIYHAIIKEILSNNYMMRKIDFPRAAYILGRYFRGVDDQWKATRPRI